MRVALVTHKFPPASLGGVETYTYNLARALTEQGHQVSVFYREDANGAIFREGWRETAPFRVWRVGRAFDASQADPAHLFFDTFLNRDVEKSFQRFLAETQPDLVHFQHLMLLSTRLPQLVQKAGMPMLLTLHDYWFRCANSQLLWPGGKICKGKLGGINCARCATVRAGSAFVKAVFPVLAPVFQWRDYLVKQAALRIGNFISPSQFLRDQYLKEGFPSARFTVLENGIDVARIRAFPKIPCADRALRVTYLGSLAWQKGVHILIEAMRGLPPQRIRLRVFGNPNIFPDYAAQLRSKADSENTVFEGAILNTEVGRVLANTDILAVPSLWYENSPVVIQEAHAAGVPVIASRLGALTEKVRDGVDGLLVAPGDVETWHEALQELISQPERLAALRAAVPKPLSFSEHLARLQEIYLGDYHANAATP